MSDIESPDQARRRRLRQIADEHTEEIYAERTRAQLSGTAAAARYAAVTSEGSAESSYAHNGNLLVAPSLAVLATRLASEAAEGWIAQVASGTSTRLGIPGGTSRSPIASC